MVADTYDPLLGLLEMGTGNQNNSWGSSFNASMTTMVARAIAGSIVRSVTGGTLDLSGSPPPAGPRQDIDHIQIFQNTLVAHQTVIVPNLGKSWWFFNQTGGAFNLYVKTPSGNPIIIPQGTAKLVFCDNSNVLRRHDNEEIGRLILNGGTSTPLGTFACNGASLLRADFPDLFGVIGVTWGAVDGTHFSLPNFQDTGRFLRSNSGSIAVGTYQANQNKSHTHTGSGTTSTESADHTHTGSGTTSGQSVSHTHGFTAVLGPNGVTYAPNAGSSSGASTAAGSNTGAASVDHSHTYSFGTSGVSAFHTHTYSFTTSTGSADGTEARPESAAVLICIKY